MQSYLQSKYTDGKIKEDLAKCKNSDNLFIAIHSGFQNAGHLLNSMIAENCDIRRNVLSINQDQMILILRLCVNLENTY